MEEERICTHCGEVISEGEGTTVNGDLLCEECVDEHCITCDHCGEVIYTDDCITDDHTWLCQDCFEDYYRRCESCDRIIHDNDVNWHSDLPYCDSCYDDLDSDDEIEEYSYKPTPLFRGDGKRYFGVELEIDCGGKDNDYAYRLKNIGNSQLENIYIKSDGSLDEGLEIVSHPMTLDYHMNEMDWQRVMKEAVNLGYRSHQTSTCGLHVHVNRNAFGDNQSEQEEVISKILFFVEKNWNEVFKFSRRNSYNMNRWSARYGLLRREWDKEKKSAMIVMINPNTADTLCMDLTTMLTLNNLSALGFGSVNIVNLYSRITSKLNLRFNSDDDLIAKECDEIIHQYATMSDAIIIAWGTVGKNTQRVRERQKYVLRDNGDKMYLHSVRIVSDNYAEDYLLEIERT